MNLRLHLTALRQLSHFVVPYRKAALLSTLFVSLTVLINLVPPLLYKLLVDEGIRGGNVDQLVKYVAVIAAAIVASSVLQVVEEYFSCQFGLVMMNDVRNRLYRHLQSLPLGFFHSTSSGAIITRFTSDLLNLQKVVARTLPSVLTNVFMIVFSLAVMFYLSWELTLVTVIGIPFYAVFAWKVSRIVADVSARAMGYGDRMMTTLGEDFGVEGLTFFKLFGIEGQRRDAFRALTAKIQQIRLKLSLWGRSNSVAVDMVQALGVVAIYYIGGQSVIAGSLTIGTIIAFSAIAIRLYQPIAFFSTSVIDLPTALLSMERINAFLAIPAQCDGKQGGEAAGAALAVRRAAGGVPSIVFDNVSFQYPGVIDGAGIRNVSFTIDQGERVALVGPNGSGKTTLVLLLAGIYRPSAGEIYIDGQAISALRQEQIVPLIGVGLGQGFFLNASIRDNLRMVREDASDADLERALATAGCARFIGSLPEGLDTPLGQSGLKLSTGQRQRLTLARLFLKNSKVLCFDETTANIDAESEELLIDTIYNSPLLSTALVISHSLKTTSQARRILVLDDGRLVGDGSHPQLSSTCPAYRRLYGEAMHVNETIGEAA